MESHVRVLGILFIVLSAIGLVVGLGILMLFGGIAGLVATSNEPDAAMAMPIMGAIGGIIFIVLLAAAVPGIITGIGLLKYREWARILGIVLSALNLLGIPLFTILGIYGLWVLLNAQTAALFQQRRMPPAQYGGPAAS